MSSSTPVRPNPNLSALSSFMRCQIKDNLGDFMPTDLEKDIEQQTIIANLLKETRIAKEQGDYATVNRNLPLLINGSRMIRNVEQRQAFSDQIKRLQVA